MHAFGGCKGSKSPDAWIVSRVLFPPKTAFIIIFIAENYSRLKWIHFHSKKIYIKITVRSDIHDS